MTLPKLHLLLLIAGQARLVLNVRKRQAYSSLSPFGYVSTASATVILARCILQETASICLHGLFTWLLPERTLVPMRTEVSIADLTPPRHRYPSPYRHND